MECKDVEQAAARLQGQIHNVKVTSSRTFSEMSSCQLFLKCENRQKTGSFKVRGAFNKLAKLKEEGKTSEVIASSAGNHAQGVSYAASKLGMHATIVMPKSTPIAKVLATKGYGADVVLAGDNYDECYQEALRLQEEKGATFIHPFDDEDVIAGQGTIAYEICHDLPNVDMIVVRPGEADCFPESAFMPSRSIRVSKSLGFRRREPMPSCRAFRSRSTVRLNM